MAWWTEPLEIRGSEGDGHTGRWRMTATSDEGGGFHADESHDHGSPEECLACERCNKFASGITGIRRLTPKDAKSVTGGQEMPIEITADLSGLKTIVIALIKAINEGPKSRERSLIVTKLQEAKMWAEEAQMVE